jgi:isoaspartyl peptidase/L-asparaginase-like protein (Ntn-hydrolase superfamily)
VSHRDVEAEILEALDAFVARDGKLPATGDGKVNVAALCRDLGLRAADAQHLFRKESVKAAINAMASDQGLLLIGARADREAADESLRDNVVRTATNARRDAQSAAEQSAAASVLLEELSATRAELEHLRLVNASLEARLSMIEDGFMPPRF